MGILVVGGAGYIGSHIVHALDKQDEYILILDDLSTGSKKNTPSHVPLIIENCSNYKHLVQLMGDNNIDTVLHFAGIDGEEKSPENPLDFYYKNTETSRIVIAAAVACQIKQFIYASSASVYGDKGNQKLDEASIPSPQTPCASSILMVEQILAHTASAHEFNFLAMRLFNIIGGKGEIGGNKFRKFDNFGENISNQFAGDDLQDYLHIDDLVGAYEHALKYLRKGGKSQVLDSGSGTGYSAADINSYLGKIADEGIQVNNMPKSTGVGGRRVADLEKISRILNWQPKLKTLDQLFRLPAKNAV